MLYILDQKRGMSIPIKDGYIVYIRVAVNKELYDIIADANPELIGGPTKTEYFLGRYFDETVAHNVMKYINKLRSVGDAHYVMPKEDEEKQLQILRNKISGMEVKE
jgi:hypothetical protein